VLKIVAKKETFTDQGVTKEYTSARLNSKFAFTYGRVEIRAKLPTGAGTWPAMWMLGKNINENGAYWQTLGYGTAGWPACGEIDIMEHWGNNQNYVQSAIHTPSSFGATVNHGGRSISTVSDEFHDYTMIWTDEKIAFKIDGIPHYTYKPDVQDATTWPFNLEQYFLLNIALQSNTTSTNFTQSAMEIDYIRVYQESPNSTLEPFKDESKLVYPNPFEEEINIVSKEISEETVEVMIYNSFGVLVKTMKANVVNEKLIIKQLGVLPTGIYVIRFNSNNKLYSYKVIKK